MSTRCHIIVKGSKDEPEKMWGYIYHHFDGYPEGVGKDLEEQFKETIVNNAVGHKYKWEDIVQMITDIDGGYEVDNGIHGDEEYLYVITVENDSEGIELKCYEILPFSFDASSTAFTMDEGYKLLYTKTFRNSASGVLTGGKEKSFMEDFKKQVLSLHNVELLEMMKIICNELTIRETE